MINRTDMERDKKVGITKRKKSIKIRAIRDLTRGESLLTEIYKDKNEMISDARAGETFLFEIKNDEVNNGKINVKELEQNNFKPIKNMEYKTSLSLFTKKDVNVKEIGVVYVEEGLNHIETKELKKDYPNIDKVIKVENIEDQIVKIKSLKDEEPEGILCERELGSENGLKEWDINTDRSPINKETYLIVEKIK